MMYFLQHLETTKYLVLAFELMMGGDLHKYMLKRGSDPVAAALSEPQARSVFHQMLSGVSYAHNQRVVHRDLKLENLL